MNPYTNLNPSTPNFNKYGANSTPQPLYYKAIYVFCYNLNRHCRCLRVEDAAGLGGSLCADSERSTFASVSPTSGQGCRV